MRRLALAAALALCVAAGKTAAAQAPPPEWGRIDLVGAELFGADTAHSYVGFTIGFLGLTKVRGTFKDYTAAILYDEKDPTRSSVTVVFDPATIDTGLEGRDKFWGEKILSDEVEVEIAILGNRFNFDKWSFDSRQKPSVGEAMSAALAVKGVEAAVARYRELKAMSAADYNFGIDQVAIVGNRLLQHRRLREALEIFRLAAAEAPKEAVLQARIGETSAALGDREAALTAYRKALELAPQNPEAMEMVRRLETSVSGK